MDYREVNMKISTNLKSRLITFFLALSIGLGMGMYMSPAALGASTSSTSLYNTTGKPVIDSFRSNYNGSQSHAVVGRAIWYMEYGYMVYGHTKYPATGYIDCSNFVSLVYKDFGYSVTSAARNYDSVGVKVSGVSVKNGIMTGVDKLKPGDIITFQRTDYISHVAIYIGSFKGKPSFICTTSGYPTAIGIVSGFNNWYGTQFHSVRRVLPASAYAAGSKINAKGPVIPKIYQIKPSAPIIMPNKLPAGF